MTANSTIGKTLTFNGRGEKIVSIFNASVPVYLRHYLNETYNRRVAEIIATEGNKTNESSFVSSQKVATYGLAVYSILSTTEEVVKNIASAIEQEYSKINIEEKMPDAQFAIKLLKQVDFTDIVQVMDWIYNHGDTITDICDYKVSKIVIDEFAKYGMGSVIYSWSGGDNESWGEVIITSFLHLVFHRTGKRFEKNNILKWKEENSKSGAQS